MGWLSLHIGHPLDLDVVTVETCFTLSLPPTASSAWKRFCKTLRKWLIVCSSLGLCNDCSYMMWVWRSNFFINTYKRIGSQLVALIPIFFSWIVCVLLPTSKLSCCHICPLTCSKQWCNYFLLVPNDELTSPLRHLRLPLGITFFGSLEFLVRESFWKICQRTVAISSCLRQISE